MDVWPEVRALLRLVSDHLRRAELLHRCSRDSVLSKFSILGGDAMLWKMKRF